MTDRSTELKKNRVTFESMKEKLEARHLVRVALFHDGGLIEIFNDAEDAYLAGKLMYGLGHFTTQTIGKKPIRLGIRSLGIGAGD